MGQCDRPRGHSTRDKSKWIQGILLLSMIGTTHAISKPFINSSMPEMRPTFVVNFDISKVICQHRWRRRRILTYQNLEFPILESCKKYLKSAIGAIIGPSFIQRHSFPQSKKRVVLILTFGTLKGLDDQGAWNLIQTTSKNLVLTGLLALTNHFQSIKPYSEQTKTTSEN